MVKWYIVNVLEKILFNQQILFDLCATVSLDGNGGRWEEFGFLFTAFVFVTVLITTYAMCAFADVSVTSCAGLCSFPIISNQQKLHWAESNNFVPRKNSASWKVALILRCIFQLQLVQLLTVLFWNNLITLLLISGLWNSESGKFSLTRPVVDTILFGVEILFSFSRAWLGAVLSRAAVWMLRVKTMNELHVSSCEEFCITLDWLTMDFA